MIKMLKTLAKPNFILALSLILILYPTTNVNSSETPTTIQNVIPVRNATNFKYTIPGLKWPNASVFLDFQKQIPDAISLRNDSQYKPYTFNLRTNLPKPVVIVNARNSSEIQTAVNFARKYNLKISVQSTGSHPDVRNIQDNSVHIVLKNFKNAIVNKAEKTLQIGTGLTFSEIHEIVNRETNGALFALCPIYNTLGPYSFYTGGGRGVFTKAFGLGVDALLNVEMLKNNGEIVQANSVTNKDLFYAFRGASGSSFGIVLSLTVRLYNSPSTVSVIKGAESFQQTASQFTLNYLSGLSNDVSYFYKISNMGTYNATFSAVCVGSSGNCASSLESLKQNCQKQDDGDCIVNTYTNVYNYLSKLPDRSGSRKFYTYSSYFSKDNFKNGMISVQDFVFKTSNTECEMNAVIGGASSSANVKNSEFSLSTEQRNSFMEVFCTANLETLTTLQEKIDLIVTLDKFGDDSLSLYSTAVYWNNPTHNFAKDDWKQRYWGDMDTYNRLLSVKRDYDPENIFSCYHCIGYDLDIFGPEPVLCETSSCSCTNNANGFCSISSKIVNVSAFDMASVLNFKFLVFLFFLILI